MTLVAESPTPKSLDTPMVAPAAQINGYALSLAEQDLFRSRKRWTQKECASMEEAGVLTPGEYELLNGEIVLKAGQYIPHSRACKRVFLAAVLVFGVDYVFMPASVVIDDENSPEPDILVMQFPDRHYIGMNTPLPADMRLVVEVSDATLWRDRNTKMVLYAQAGVPEYWTLDVNGRTLWVHRNPTPTGYSDIQAYDETQSITPLTAPTGSAPIAVASLLP